MIVSSRVENNVFKFRYLSERGNIEHIDVPISTEEQYEWRYSSRNSVASSWDNMKLAKQPIKDFDKYGLSKYMMKYWNWKVLDGIDNPYEFSDKRMIFVDIETQILGTGIFDVKNPIGQIQTVAITNGNKIMVMGLKELKPQQILLIQNKISEHFKKHATDIKFNYLYCNSETQLLIRLINDIFLKANIITGWNFIEFDWKYIINRCKLLNIPLDKLSMKNERGDYLPYDIIVDDYMELMKKYEISINMKESAKLDDVAFKLLDIRKVEYDGSLQDLYQDDFESYVYYNAVDSFLTKLIHEKTHCIQVKAAIANITRISYYEADSNVNQMEGILQYEFLKQGKYVTDAPHRKHHLILNRYKNLIDVNITGIIEVRNKTFNKIEIKFPIDTFQDWKKELVNFELKSELETGDIVYSIRFGNQEFECDLSSTDQGDIIEFVISSDIDDPVNFIRDSFLGSRLSFKRLLVGGYVYDCKPGRYKNIMVFDFSSLYPTTVQNFSISPESFLGMERNLKGQYNKDEVITTDWGAIFRKEESIMRTFVKDIYSRRKNYQRMALDAESEINDIDAELKRRSYDIQK